MKQIGEILSAASICVILFLSILMMSNLANSKIPKNSENISENIKLLSLPAEEIDKISIAYKEEKFTLVNLGNKFAIENAEEIELEENKISELLNLLKNFEVKESENSEITEGNILKIEIYPTNSEIKTLEIEISEKTSKIRFKNKIYEKTSEEIKPFLVKAENYAKKSITEKINSTKELKLTINNKEISNPLNISYFGIRDCYLTSPKETRIDEKTAKKIINSIFGLEAAETVKISPSEEDIKKYKLSENFSILECESEGKNFSIKTSEILPDENIYLMNSEKRAIYKVNSKELEYLWISEESLCEENIFQKNYNDTTKLIIETEKNKYVFTKWKGEVLCNGKPIPEESFRNLYNETTKIIPTKIALIKRNNNKSVLRITISYTNPEKRKDEIEFFEFDKNNVYVKLNENEKFLTSKTSCEKIAEICEKI